MNNLLWPVLVAGFLCAFMILIAYGYRRVARAMALYRQIQASGALLCLLPWHTKVQMFHIGTRAPLYGSCLLAIHEAHISLYPQPVQSAQPVTFSSDQLRWFGRPKKYTPGTNEIWLHLEGDSRWTLVKIRLHQHYMYELVRTLKAIATPEQVTAYRRRRPYIHLGPVQVHPASQDIHGAWSLEDPVELYLTPAFLVILRSGVVLRTIPLAAVQQIGALKRLDAPHADGLVRFQADGETMAFALPHYQAFSDALATAARHSLEQPVVQKSKVEDSETDPDDDDYPAFIDHSLASEFVIGDDGELHFLS